MNDADGLGSITTGALLAREVERAQAGAPAIGHKVDEPCANCGTIRAGAYCHACGQAGHVHRNLGALVHDLAHGVFHFEGKIWATLPLLIRRPGDLTRRYVHGERAKFISPMALFLFSMFLMFAVVANLTGHVTNSPDTSLGIKIKSDANRNFARDIGNHRARLTRLAAARAGTTDPARQAALDARIRDVNSELAVLLKLQGSFLMSPATEDAKAHEAAAEKVDTGSLKLNTILRHAAANPELVLYKMKSYAYKYSWALIPISLPFLWLLFAFRRDVGLYDHAIFAIYSLSFMSLGVVALVALSAAGVPTPLIVIAALLVPPVHMYRQLKGAYRLGRFAAGWRTAALLIITLITALLFFTLIVYLGSD